MYLVDDVLYKKIINPKTNLINPYKLPSQTAGTIFKKSDDFKSTPTPQSVINILDSGDPPPPVMNITDPAPSPPPSADTYMEQSSTAESNQPPPPQPDADKPNKNKVVTGGGEPACSCFNPPNPGKKRKRGVMKVPPRKRPTSQTGEEHEDKPPPKRRKMNPLKADIPEEEEYDWDNDPEISEMRERFNKIKYDINYPPPKTPRLKKTKKEANVENTVTYLCSICDTYFKHRHQLAHHISVQHPSFSQAAGTPASSGGQPPKPRIMREERMSDLKRGVKRKSTQEKPYHKKTKTDGRQKRKSIFQDSPSKKRKSEFGCALCHSFLKSEKALRRHEKNVHDSRNDNEKLKRKGNDTAFSGSYLKRQKVQPHPPVLYQNYF